jgi:hypothetical protein
LPHRQKKPIDAGWQNRTITEADVEAYFNSKPMNIGVVLGPSSHGLTDIDLDCPEAVALAPWILPKTGAIFGRASARSSHWLYATSLAGKIEKATIRLKDTKRRDDRAVLVELRIGPGCQTVFPGSTHESGEAVTWEEAGEPAAADGDDLMRRFHRLAAACMFARYWPGEGNGSHEASLALGGFLARAGISAPEIRCLVEAIARAAADAEWQDRRRAAEDAAIGFKQGKRAFGYPEICKVFGEDIASTCADWLGYDGARSDETSETPPEPVVAMSYVWKAPESLAPRGWVYGRRLVRKYVTATVAPGGIGKSSLEISEVVAMISGRGLLGIKPPAPLRVWLWNLEDPRDETERHIQATAKLFGLTPEDIADRLYVNCAREARLVIVTAIRDKATIVRPVIDRLVAEILRNRIDVVIIDPLISCHEVSENDNGAMDTVAKAWGLVAELGNCSVELVHHTRKGDAEITVDSSRGGSALANACRNVRVLNRMSEEDGEKAGVTNHRLYFRAYSDKATLVPPADKSDWYRLEGVDLCNGLPGESDLVGVVRQWQWPDAMAGMTAADFDKVAAVVRAGRWRESSQAKSWVGYAVAKALGLNADNRKDRTRILSMLKIWFAAGSLIKVEAPDEHRELRLFVEVRDGPSR